MKTQKKNNKTPERILEILLREPFIDHTATSLAKTVGVTRQGLWKSLNKLSNEKLISLKSVADTKKSTLNITLEFKNPVAIKTLSLLLTKELINYERWRVNFAEIEKYISFFILFGSILTNPKEAKDIDIIAVVEKKDNFKQIEETILRIQKTQARKIHLIDLTEKEFKQELLNKNKAYLDALKKGVILFGQENLIKFITDLNKT